jgi:sugar phosphate isomerase/epimerase
MSDTTSNPLSLSYYTVPELSPPEMVSAAANAGFDFVGVRLLHGQPGGDMAPLMHESALRRETMARLRDTGLGVLDASGARITPATVISDFVPFIEVAASLGARHILATGDDPDESRLVEKLGELCDRARPFGLTVDIEFVPWHAVADLAIAVRIAHAVGQSNFGIAIDALHFDRSGSRLDDVVRIPRHWLRYVQLCDAPGRWSSDRDALLHAATKERLFPGDGAIDLAGLLRALPRGIPVALEIPMETLTRTLPASARLQRAVRAAQAVLTSAYG